MLPPPISTLFPYTTLFRSSHKTSGDASNDPDGCPHFTSAVRDCGPAHSDHAEAAQNEDRKSTRLNSSHVAISYAVFCLKKKKSPTRSDCTNRLTPRALPGM